MNDRIRCVIRGGCLYHLRFVRCLIKAVIIIITSQNRSNLARFGPSTCPSTRPFVCPALLVPARLVSHAPAAARAVYSGPRSSPLAACACRARPSVHPSHAHVLTAQSIIKIGSLMWVRRKPKDKAKKNILRNQTGDNSRLSRPPTLSQCHMDLHVRSYPRRSYIFQVSSKSVQGFQSSRGRNLPFAITLAIGFCTTDGTTITAVIKDFKNQH